MRVTLAGWGLVAVAALALCAGAQGRSQDTRTVVHVEVEGLGTVTDSVINCGNGNTSCRNSYVAGTTRTYTATAATGWTFDGWSGACDDDPCDVTVDAQDDDYEVIAGFLPSGSPPGTHTLTVTTEGDANDDGGNVSGGDVDCDTGENGNGSCQWDDLYVGSVVTLVETPDDGFVFTGWGGSCSGTAVSCTLTIGSSDPTVHAGFRKPKLTVNVTGNGTVTGDGITCTSGSSSGCSADETAGASVTLTATPGSGGSFTGWSGACSGKEAVCTLTMSADKNVTAAFSGGSVAPTTYPLTVSVTGNGTVTGGGITCGAEGSTCSANVQAGTNVTLTASPSSGETFQSWSGACSGSTPTCSVSMNAAKSVTATFSGGSAATVALTLAVSGRGTVTGGGISCGNGKTACNAHEQKGSSVGLTATPAAGATFKGWGGACKGKTPTCTVEMDDAQHVTAAFTGVSRVPAGSVALARVGSPAVSRTSSGFRVTLRFRTNERGQARMRALRAGRIQTALAFTTARGTSTVGPFPVAKAGFYTFEVRLGARIVRWGACLGRCGERASAAPFALTRGLPTVVDAGALWSLALHFRSTQPAGAVVRVYRDRTLARELRFPIGTGRAAPGALLLSPGTYRIRLVATDAVGRVRTLTWYALLP
jgi:uncharacterized repeat protein (TIGR02543 family)